MRWLKLRRKIISVFLSIALVVTLIMPVNGDGDETWSQYVSRTGTVFRFNADYNLIYLEKSDGYWYRYDRDDNSNLLYEEDSNGYYRTYEYDDNGNMIYYEDSDGFWCKYEYNEYGEVTHRESSEEVSYDYEYDEWDISYIKVSTGGTTERFPAYSYYGKDQTVKATVGEPLTLVPELIYCDEESGEEISVDLSDEQYTFKWYAEDITRNILYAYFDYNLYPNVMALSVENTYTVDEITLEDISDVVNAKGDWKYECLIYKNGEYLSSNCFYIVENAEGDTDVDEVTTAVEDTTVTINETTTMAAVNEINAGNQNGNKNNEVTTTGTVKENAIVRETLEKVTSVNAKSTAAKKVKLTWKKTAGASGYQIMYATNNKFTKNKKTMPVKKAKTTSKVIKKLKSGKKYFFKVRAYTVTNGKKSYGKWSKVKKVKVK